MWFGTDNGQSFKIKPRRNVVLFFNLANSLNQLFGLKDGNL